MPNRSTSSAFCNYFSLSLHHGTCCFYHILLVFRHRCFGLVVAVAYSALQHCGYYQRLSGPQEVGKEEQAVRAEAVLR